MDRRLRMNDDFDRGHQTCLIGKRDLFPAAECFVRCCEAYYADGGGDDKISLPVSSDGEHAFAAMVNCRKGNAFVPKPGRELFSSRRVANGDEIRLVPFSLFCKCLDVLARGPSDDATALRQGLH